MNTFIIKACTDLGTIVDGANLGPDKITENENYTNIIKIEKENIVKSKDKNDFNKNMDSINRFNEKLYNSIRSIIRNGCFPITIGGDHSITIASALGSIKENNDLGIIWIDSHGDFNTPLMTPTGSIHGYPFAAICNYKNKDLVKFHNGKFYNPKNAVLVGARDIDMPYELDNLKEAGVTIFTTKDIIDEGVDKIMNKAFEIASKGNLNVHVSYDIDSIDPNDAPGVSIPAKNGFSKEIAYEILNYITNNSNIIKSMDIVEYNPVYDIDNKTLLIAKNILKEIINAKEKE